ncbi:MAG: c-type cytochrome [Ignavibacteriales bacterium]|nr:c-type cytochrome [Ignavibacteriales bacterium]
MLNKSIYFTYAMLAALVFVVLLTACNQTQPEKKVLSEKEMIERGKYLITAGGCHDCHSPKVFGPQGPKIDETKILSGHPAEMQLAEFDPAILEPGKYILFTQDVTAAIGPWGASFAANLTPDNETGIGTWQPEMFINALRTGKHLGAGRPILPPMPWEMVGKLTDEDLQAMFAYLKSIPPVKNKVPDPKPLDQLLSSK